MNHQSIRAIAVIGAFLGSMSVGTVMAHDGDALQTGQHERDFQVPAERADDPATTRRPGMLVRRDEPAMTGARVAPERQGDAYRTDPRTVDQSPQGRSLAVPGNPAFGRLGTP